MSAPLLRRLAHAPYFHPLFNFSDPLPPWEVIKIYFPPPLKRGVCGPSYGRYFFGRYSSELAQLVPLFFLEGDLLIILIDCIIFLSTFRDGTRMSMSIVSLLAQLDPGILYLENVFL